MRRSNLRNCFSLPKQMPTARFFFLISFTSFTISLLWVQLVSNIEQPANESLIQEALKNVAKDFRYTDVYRKASRLPKELKYILLWTDYEFAPFYYLGNGQRMFIRNNCSVINCYVTTDRYFFDGDTTKFDAIAFNGRNMRVSDLPTYRSPRQKFIFFNTESSDNYPVCSSTYDGYFNWTSTYRLDSDVPFPYFNIRNRNGDVVGPKIRMHWTEYLPQEENFFDVDKLANKSKAVAWFVSNCSSRSGRTQLVKKLQKALSRFGYTVDIYGACGPLECPKNKKNACDLLLERDYYFYLSFENSIAEDYVTEKLITALQHHVVPIVFGGADYNRFLPPNSYLKASIYDVHSLAATIHHLIKTPEAYRNYFKWRGQYNYSIAMKENVCDLCAALNNKEKMETRTVYEQFRSWWNPLYSKRCWHFL